MGEWQQAQPTAPQPGGPVGVKADVGFTGRDGGIPGESILPGSK